jgi:hypothetical protein
MPLYLRRFIFNEIKEFYDEENKATKKSPKNPNQKIIHPGHTSNTSTPTTKRPSTTPSKSVKYK